MLLNKDQVISFLPHRSPFLFVDSIEELTVPDAVKEKKAGEIQNKDLVGSKLIAHFKVTETLDILKGHFPGNPILPGVIQVEMMAQASAFVSIAFNDMKVEGVNVDTILLSVESAKFRKPILPGMDLKIFSSLDKCRGSIASYSCEIFSGDEKVSEAKFLAKLEVKRES